MRDRRFAVFVDGSNLSKAIKAAGYRLDYDKILAFYNALGTIVDASYFTALPPRGVTTPLRRFVDRLSYNGWTLETKEVKYLLTHDGVFKDKGDMDIEIAVKAVRLASRITDLILFSGDGDFKPLVAYLQEQGVQVTAVSHLSPRDDCVIADELRRQVNWYLDLKGMKQHWEAGT